MDTHRPTRNEQHELWNGPAGQGWVHTQAALDQMFQPLEALLVAAARALDSDHVLDVGCGTGATTLAIARTLGAACTGIDISDPMLSAARARAEREGSTARFVRADAQTYAFEPASFDTVVSRFGVMFFDAPAPAFANLRRATRPGAALRFIAWRSPAENPFMTTAERAAAALLPLPPRRPGAPGQFAFAERERVHNILQQAGWNDIHLEPIDVACSLPEPELTPYLSRLGPVGLALNAADEPTRTRVVEAVRAAFDTFVQGDTVRYTAACWMVSARN